MHSFVNVPKIIAVCEFLPSSCKNNIRWSVFKKLLKHKIIQLLHKPTHFSPSFFENISSCCFKIDYAIPKKEMEEMRGAQSETEFRLPDRADRSSPSETLHRHCETSGESQRVRADMTA